MELGRKMLIFKLKIDVECINTEMELVETKARTFGTERQLRFNEETEIFRSLSFHIILRAADHQRIRTT